MTEDEPFIRALLAAPDDQTTRLVYADWLDDRGDPRAEYLRLQAHAANQPLDSEERRVARERMLSLQHGLPSWWLAVVGFRAVAQEPDPARIEEAAKRLNRPATFTDEAGYAVAVRAAAISGLTGALVYLEERSQWRGQFHDITYTLKLCAADGREAAGEPYTYNPYFGCFPQFLEWYGDVAVMIYMEKHQLCACRLGFNEAIESQQLAGNHSSWALDGYELGVKPYRSTEVLRLRLPDLTDLPALPIEEWNARGAVLSDQ